MSEFNGDLATAFKQLGCRGSLEAGRFTVDIGLWRYVDDVSFQRDCQAALTTPERQRAQELHAPGARSAFVQRRAYLGWLLGTDSGAMFAPTKPTSNQDHLTNDRAISVSSTRTHAIFAVSPGIKKIGLDVEIANEKHNILALADALFSAAETTALKQADPGTATDLFYRIWRLKEAALKYRNCGLAEGLNDTLFIPVPQGGISVCQNPQGSRGVSTASAFFEGRFKGLDLALALPAMPGDAGLWQVAKATPQVQPRSS